MRLHALVAKRNVRRIVVHVTRRTANAWSDAAVSHKALVVLQTHGFQVEFSVREDGGKRSILSTLHQLESVSTSLTDTVKTLHIVEKGLGHNDESALAVELPVVSSHWTNSLQRLAAEILGLATLPSSSVRLFGAHLVSTTQIFHETVLSFCLVNLKPIVPGHILVISKRCVARFEHLEADEVGDLWTTAQVAGSVIQRHYGASSLTFAIQDGPEAGQTVRHVHIHVIPRHQADFDKNDEIYTRIESHERRLHVDNEERTARTQQDMAAEATLLREKMATLGPL